MIFMNSYYIIFIIGFLALYYFFVSKKTSAFFKWIECHWFYKQSKKNKLSFILNLVGITLLSIALLDLRGKEEHVQGKISHQKTIILIDSSASMLAEDVRPNRFEKGLLLIKHYVKKAIGQQISIVVFSDGQKRIVPFTDDVDLLLARIESLRKLKLERGGTGLSLAIQESIQYFRSNSKEISGNVLIFTDAEETDGGIELNIPKDITVGVVGIGTAKGAPIPVRDRRGVFVGNKKFKGEVVISKLNEKYLASLGAKIDNFKSWIATSYTLPTMDIVKFFTNVHDIKNSKNSFRIRPILSNYLVIPGVLFLCFSFLLNNFKTFVSISMFMFVFTVMAQEQGDKEKKEKVKSEYVKKLEEKFSKNNLSFEGRKVLARELFKEGFSKDSEALYEETLKSDITNENVKDKFNLAASKLKNSKLREGINAYNEILDHIKKNPTAENSKMINDVKENIAKAFRANNGKGSSKGKKSKEEDKKNKSKDQKNDKKNKDKNKQDNKDQNKQKKDGKSGDDKKENKDNKDGKDKKNKDEQSKKNNDENKKKDKDKGNKQRNKKKLPAILKQLMSGDDQLQKKMIDAKTTKRKSRDRKDW